MKQKFIAVDLETKGLKPYQQVIWMLSVTEDKTTTVYRNCNGLTRKDLPRDLILNLASPKCCKIIHNANFDGPMIKLNLDITLKNIWDTQLCEIVLLGMRLKQNTKDKELKDAYSTSLASTLARYKLPVHNKDIRENFINREFGIPFTASEVRYAANDTKYLIKLQKLQQEKLERENLLPVAALENKVVEKMISMRSAGIGFSKKIWGDIAIETKETLLKERKKLPKDVANWNSPGQVKEYFFDYHQIEIPSLTKIKKIAIVERQCEPLQHFAFVVKSLQTFSQKYGIKKWIEPAKDKSSKNGLVSYVDEDNRIRCDLDQIIDTGRNSISNPPLQQMPNATNHRRAFIPKEGHCFIIGDFSAQEIGIMAVNANEKMWLDALLQGNDPHAITAYNLNASAWNKAAKKDCCFPRQCECPGHLKMRKPAKVNNFMMAYGGGPDKLAEATGMNLEDATQYFLKHQRLIPNVVNWLKENGNFALHHNVSYSADPFKRRRVLALEYEDWQKINRGKNTPVQSAGANMLKLALTYIPDDLQIVLVIHDEIILEVPIKTAKIAAKKLQKAMQDASDYITGIPNLVKVKPQAQMNIMKDLKVTKNFADIKTGKFCYKF
jgi:DNA polymerase I-like protein with 3'-5' exonuclease and polymerase domains